MSEREVLELMRDVAYCASHRTGTPLANLLDEIGGRLAALPAAAQADGEEPPTLIECFASFKAAYRAHLENPSNSYSSAQDAGIAAVRSLMPRARPAPSHAPVEYVMHGGERFTCARCNAMRTMKDDGPTYVYCHDCAVRKPNDEIERQRKLAEHWRLVASDKADECALLRGEISATSPEFVGAEPLAIRMHNAYWRNRASTGESFDWMKDCTDDERDRWRDAARVALDLAPDAPAAKKEGGA